MLRRTMFAIGSFLLVFATCSAAQAPAEKSAAVDTLVKKVAGPISKSKMKSIVVVGFSGPGKTVTDLGTILRDEVSDALARQLSDVKVIDRAAIDAMLKQNRVSEGMLYNASMGDWIATHVHADGYVTAHFEVPESGPSPVTIEIFKCGAESCSRMGVPIVTEMTLNAKEFLASGQGFTQTINSAAFEPDQNGVTHPRCISCANPSYTDEARKLKINGKLLMVVTVEADGSTNDIFIEQPLGHGLDGAAIDGVLKWKFEPAVDANGHAVATHVQLEVSFSLK
jgi:TonB family protein